MDAEPLLCVVCSTPDRPRTAVEGLRVCGRDRDSLAQWLEDIAAWWPTLSVYPTTGDGGRRAPGFRSTSPARDDVLAVTDRRVTWQEPGDLHHPPTVLAGWADVLRGELGHTYAPTGADHAAAYLRKHLAHVCRQEWVADMWPEIREVRNQLERLSPEPAKRVLVGRCPNLVDTGGQHPEKCGTRLYLPATGSTIPCGGCGRRYERPEWRQLGEDMQEAG